MSAKHSSDAVIILFRWSARVLSVASTAMLLVFLFGERFEPSEITGKQWLAMTFFPLGIVVGFAVAWWREGLGGAITIASLLIFYLIFVSLLKGNLARGGWFAVFAAPGFLFLATYLLTRSWGLRRVKYRAV